MIDLGRQRASRSLPATGPIATSGGRRPVARPGRQTTALAGGQSAADAAFESVLAAARTNAAWAWESIYHEFAPRVLAYLRMERPELAEDVLGEVFVGVVRDIRSFEGGPDAFRAWIMRMARNRLVDALRVANRRVEVPYAELPDTGAGPARSVSDIAEHVIASADRQRLVRTLSVLPPEQRTVVYMRYVVDLPHADIASQLGKTVCAVKMLQHRALATLADRLRQPLRAG